MTFNIYVASYGRANTTTTKDLVEYCTYVVRKSQEKAYRNAGIQNIWAVEDEYISSFSKVQNYIIENAPEDIVAVLDDDIKHFRYSMDRNLQIKDVAIATAELERLGQLLVDLDIGLGILRPTANPKGYHKEYSFSGGAGAVRVYNRKKIKARYREIKFFVDTDFILQELLVNRIVLRPECFSAEAIIETNIGGMNGKRIRSEQIACFKDELKAKWGKYVSYNPKNNTTVINVNRQN